MRDRPAPVHSVPWHLLLAGIVMPFALPLGFLAGGATARWFGFSWGTPDFGSYRIGIVFGLVTMLLFFFQRTRTEAREAARAAETRIKDLEAARLQAQLSALAAEMNPHLLFNSLNTVASLLRVVVNSGQRFDIDGAPWNLAPCQEDFDWPGRPIELLSGLARCERRARGACATDPVAGALTRASEPWRSGRQALVFQGRILLAVRLQRRWSCPKSSSPSTLLQ